MDPRLITDLQSSYDRVAEEYVQRIYNELENKPLDRQLLDRLAAGVGDRGPVCDLGCGPGHVARYLSVRGASVRGVDLSARMVEEARRLNPDIEFEQGNMLALDAKDDSWSGIAAFYSIIHVPRDEVASALREMRRVLRPRGLLLLAFHIGDETIHMDEWWGRPVSVDFHFFQPQEIVKSLTASGFDVEDLIERPPYPDVEYQSRRAYIFARKPAGKEEDF